MNALHGADSSSLRTYRDLILCERRVERGSAPGARHLLRCYALGDFDAVGDSALGAGEVILELEFHSDLPERLGNRPVSTFESPAESWHDPSDSIPNST